MVSFGVLPHFAPSTYTTATVTHRGFGWSLIESLRPLGRLVAAKPARNEGLLPF